LIFVCCPAQVTETINLTTTVKDNNDDDEEMDFDDMSEKEVGKDKGHMDIQNNSKKSTVWRFFVKTKRQYSR